MNFLKYRKISLSFLILSIALVSVHSYADELSSKVTSLFREPNAELTKFKGLYDYDEYDDLEIEIFSELIEEQRQGSGWRYSTYGDTLHNNVIIYNHSHRGRKNSYFDYARNIPESRKNHRSKEDFKKAIWYFNKGVTFYAPLRKQTKDLSGDYGRRVEPIEVFTHMTKKVKEIHGEDVNICYVGHSEGGGSVLYASLYFDGNFVALSPSSNAYASFAFLNKEVYELPELFDKFKNLTVIYGSEELKSWERGRKISNLFDKLSHTNSLVMKDYAHTNFSENIFIDEYGIEVLKGCGFTPEN